MAGFSSARSRRAAAYPATTLNASARFSRDSDRRSLPEGIGKYSIPSRSTMERSSSFFEPIQTMRPENPRDRSAWMTARPG